MQGGQEFQSLTMLFSYYCLETFGTLRTPCFCKSSMMPRDKIKLLQIEVMYMHQVKSYGLLVKTNLDVLTVLIIFHGVKRRPLTPFCRNDRMETKIVCGGRNLAQEIKQQH